MVYCEICKFDIHRNSLWKHKKSDRHINNLRYEGAVNYNDIVPEWLF